MATLENTQVDKTLEDIRADLYSKIGSSQEIGDFPKKLSLYNGVVRGIVELSAWGLFQLYKFLKFKLTQGFPHLSTGVDLIEHCKAVGVEQKLATKTQGTLKVSRISTSGNLTIPLGAIFKTKPDSQGIEYRFITTESAICLDGNADVNVNVEAEKPGRVFNIGAGLITEFVTTLNGFDSVTNDPDWITTEGHDIESESSLKARYTLQWKSISGLNGAYYEKIAREIDGVIDVFIDDQQPDGRQAGVDVILRGETGAPTQSVIDHVQATIDEKSRLFDDVQVFPVEIISQSIEAELVLTSGDPEEIKTLVTERLYALNDPLTELQGVSPLQIRQNLTMDTLIVAAKVKGVNKINWTTPTADVMISDMQLIQISNITLTHTFA